MSSAFQQIVFAVLVVASVIGAAVMVDLYVPEHIDDRFDELLIYWGPKVLDKLDWAAYAYIALGVGSALVTRTFGSFPIMSVAAGTTLWLMSWVY